MILSWEDKESVVLMNPAYSNEEKVRVLRILEVGDRWLGHVWLSTSGSTAPKWVGLSKQAILASAEAVNRHLKSDSKDRWINTLPDFHVGGLGIWARAYLSESEVFDFKEAHPGKWNPEAFLKYVQECKGTLTSLVPTQLHDLVSLGYRVPRSLRAVIIGGGALLPELYDRAIGLGWPVLPSYGLTECSSQVATASLDSLQKNEYPALELLSHLEVCEKGGRLCFSGASLLSTYAYIQEDGIHFFDPKVGQWLVSEDCGAIRSNQIHILGRADGMIKVGGENVDLSRLEALWQTLCLDCEQGLEAVLFAGLDVRLGKAIHLAVAFPDKEKLSLPLKNYQQAVLPFERIRKIFVVPHLPRSPLGKVLKKELEPLVESAPEIDPKGM